MKLFEMNAAHALMSETLTDEAFTFITTIADSAHMTNLYRQVIRESDTRSVAIKEMVWSKRTAARALLEAGRVFPEGLLSDLSDDTVSALGEEFLSILRTAIESDNSHPGSIAVSGRYVTQIASHIATSSMRTSTFDLLKFSDFIAGVTDPKITISFLNSVPHDDRISFLAFLRAALPDYEDWLSDLFGLVDSESMISTFSMRGVINLMEIVVNEKPGPKAFKKWGSVRWDCLTHLTDVMRAPINAVIFNYITSRLDDHASQEVFVGIADSFEGTVDDLIITCKEV